MPGLIGKKIGMTSIFNEDGKNIPCTIIQAGPCVVTQLKTDEVDGYSAVQLSFDEQKEKRMTKALAGHFSKAKTTAKKKLVEFEMPEEEINLGDTFAVDIIEEGSYVTVVGTSKGKGFQGVVKRHGFKGVNDATHGQHNYPGSQLRNSSWTFCRREFKHLERHDDQRFCVNYLRHTAVLGRVDDDHHVFHKKRLVPNQRHGKHCRLL